MDMAGTRQTRTRAGQLGINTDNTQGGHGPGILNSSTHNHNTNPEGNSTTRILVDLGPGPGNRYIYEQEQSKDTL